MLYLSNAHLRACMHFTSPNAKFLTQGGAAFDPCQLMALPLDPPGAL